MALTEIAEKVGCYKTILDCNQDNIRESIRDHRLTLLTILRDSILRKVRVHPQGIRNGQVCHIARLYRDQARLYRDQASPIINEHVKLASSCGYMLQSIVHWMAKECVQHAKGAI